MTTVAAFSGALRYEFSMQVRRRSLWIGFGLLSLFVFRNFGLFYFGNTFITNAPVALTSWASFLGLFFPIGAGLLIADRYARDRRLHVDELLTSAPTGHLTRLLGKYVGSVLATLVPIFLAYGVGAMLIIAHWGDVGAIPLALGAFVATSVVAVLFVGAFSIACTTVLWPVLYQFLFVGYWFWGNFLNPHIGIPTLNGTLLSPDGRFILRGFFPVASAVAATITPGQAAASLALLLGCAAIALIVAWQGVLWWENHR